MSTYQGCPPVPQRVHFLAHKYDPTDALGWLFWYEDRLSDAHVFASLTKKTSEYYSRAPLYPKLAVPRMGKFTHKWYGKKWVKNGFVILN